MQHKTSFVTVFGQIWEKICVLNKFESQNSPKDKMARIKSFARNVKLIIVSDFENASPQHRLFIYSTNTQFSIFKFLFHSWPFTEICGYKKVNTQQSFLFLFFLSLCIETPVLFILSCFSSQQPVC
jgi:hypothetical protein